MAATPVRPDKPAAIPAQPVLFLLELTVGAPAPPPDPPAVMHPARLDLVPHHPPEARPHTIQATNLETIQTQQTKVPPV